MHVIPPLEVPARSLVGGRLPSGVGGSHWIQLTCPTGWPSSRWVSADFSVGKVYDMCGECVTGLYSRVGHR